MIQDSPALPLQGKDSIRALQLLQATYSEPYLVYGLYCPVTQALRYIGITSRLAIRMSEHMRDEKGTQGKNDWIAYLKSLGFAPYVRILDTAHNERVAKIKEIRYIFHFVQHGQPLTNWQIAWFPQKTLDLQQHTSINWLADMHTRPRFWRDRGEESIYRVDVWIQRVKPLMRYWIYEANKHCPRLTTTQYKEYRKSYSLESRY